MSAPTNLASLPTQTTDTLPWVFLPEDLAVKAYLGGWVAFWLLALFLSLWRWGFRPVLDLLGQAFAASGRIGDKVFGETVAVGFLAIFLLLGFAVAPLILYAGIPVVGYQVGKASIRLPLAIIDQREDALDQSFLGGFRDVPPQTTRWYSQPVSWGEHLTASALCRLGLMPLICRNWLVPEAELHNQRPVSGLVTEIALRDLGYCDNPSWILKYPCLEGTVSNQYSALNEYAVAKKDLHVLRTQQAVVRQREAINPGRVTLQLSWRPGAKREFDDMARSKYEGFMDLIGFLAGSVALILTSGLLCAGPGKADEVGLSHRSR